MTTARLQATNLNVLYSTSPHARLQAVTLNVLRTVATGTDPGPLPPDPTPPPTPIPTGDIPYSDRSTDTLYKANSAANSFEGSDIVGYEGTYVVNREDARIPPTGVYNTSLLNNNSINYNTYYRD